MSTTEEGLAIAKGIVDAYQFAYADPWRAATHNKGIMNGIDPVVIATGNDWRAIEAGAHAWAARVGSVSFTDTMAFREGCLIGTLEMPMQVGTVGGCIRNHPSGSNQSEVAWQSQEPKNLQKSSLPLDWHKTWAH